MPCPSQSYRFNHPDYIKHWVHRELALIPHNADGWPYSHDRLLNEVQPQLYLLEDQEHIFWYPSLLFLMFLMPACDLHSFLTIYGRMFSLSKRIMNKKLMDSILEIRPIPQHGSCRNKERAPAARR